MRTVVGKADDHLRPVRFAIIGSGAIAPTHARVLAALPDAELTAIHSRSIEKGKALADQFGCRYFENYQELLQHAEIDAVAICTPSGAHAAFALDAAKAGKHVVIEKPLEISLEQADAIIAACNENNVQLGCVFQRRFSPGIVKLKALLDDRRLGELQYAGCYAKLYRSQEYYDSGAWRGTWELDGGGVLMNQGIHYADLLQYLAGPVAEVWARCATLGHERIEVEDTVAASVRFTNGAVGVIEATTNAWPGLASRIDLYGSEGTAVIENDDLVYVSLKSGEEFRSQPATDQVGVSSPAVSDDFHAAQYRQIVAALRVKQPLLIDGSEGRKALEIILAVYKSAFTGQAVALPLDSSRFLVDLAFQAKQERGFPRKGR